MNENFGNPCFRPNKASGVSWEENKVIEAGDYNLASVWNHFYTEKRTSTKFPGLKNLTIHHWSTTYMQHRHLKRMYIASPWLAFSFLFNFCNVKFKYSVRKQYFVGSLQARFYTVYSLANFIRNSAENDEEKQQRGSLKFINGWNSATKGNVNLTSLLWSFCRLISSVNEGM